MSFNQSRLKYLIDLDNEKRWRIRKEYHYRKKGTESEEAESKMSDWKKHEEHDTILTALLDALGKEYYCFDCEHFFIYEFPKKGTESDKEGE